MFADQISRNIMKNKSIVVVLVMLVVVGAPRAQNAAKSEARVETGEINGAAFHIEVPAAWNQGLVMYCHGYDLAGNPPPNWNDPQIKPVRDVFLSRGYAFAQSAYRTKGWAVKEAIEDTEALRRYFVSKYGQTRETFITGHSMGAVITIATLERYPEIYAGGMPLCGPLSPALEFLEDRVFDMLATFEYYFPGTIGSPVDVPADFKFSVTGSDRVREALKASPEKAAMFAKRYNVALIELPGVMSFWQAIVKELKQRTGGNPFDNRNTIYGGFDDDAAVNRGVKRYAADPKAREYVRQYYTPTGRVSDPVLTVHTTYDPLVPARDVVYYDVTSGVAGTSDLFVARFVVANGHCNISAPRTAAAFDALLSWVHEHKRPASGDIQE
jgi:pimeloyl-ACP methyl ester carboxylesterase